MGKSNENLVVGVDLGGTNIQAGLVTANNQVVGRAKVKTKAETGKDGVFKRVARVIADLVDQENVSWDQVVGIGIGAPGTCNIETGVVTNAVNLCWDRFPLGDSLKSEFKRPVVVDNDVNVGTWGEVIAGAAKGQQDVLGVFVGTGIGGGLVLGGRLYRGPAMTAGEIGQTILMPDGILGRRTLENFASRTSVVNLIRELILSNHKTIVSELVEGDLERVRSKVLAEALREKDELVTEVVRHSAGYVGIVIANMVTMLSLPCVVLGGGLVEALGEPYVKWIRSAFAEAVHPKELTDCKILQGKLLDDAGVVGAAGVARNRLTELSILV